MAPSPRHHESFPSIERHPARRIVRDEARLVARLAFVAKYLCPRSLGAAPARSSDDRRIGTMRKVDEERHEGAAERFRTDFGPPREECAAPRHVGGMKREPWVVATVGAGHAKLIVDHRRHIRVERA